MARLFDFRGSVTRLINQPATELNRWQRILRYSIELARHCARELGEDRATQMAAALTYRTLFSLVPVFIMALLVFRAFGGFDQVSENFNSDQVFSYLGFDSVTLDATEGKTIGNASGQQPHPVVEDPDTTPPSNDPPPAPASGPTANPPHPAQGPASEPPPGGSDTQPRAQDTSMAKPKAQDEFRQQADAVIQQLTDKVSGLSFASIGVVGMILLVWAALALIITVENCFNTIYNSDRGRPWQLRVPIYWAVLTLGPLLLAGGAYFAEKLIGMATGVPLLGTLANFAGGFTSIVTTWALLFLMYTLMPTTSVHKRPAAIGSFVAALLWEFGKIGFRLYVSNIFRDDSSSLLASLYGSLALIPLFLFWVYLTWLIILFGLELTYTLQMMHGLRFKSLAQHKQLFFDQRAVIGLMAAVGDAFSQGQILKEEKAAEHLGMPVSAVNQVANRLEAAGLIHRIDPEEANPGYALSKPSESIRLRDILDLADELTLNTRLANVGSDHATQTIERIRTAQRNAAAEVTLADLCYTDQPRQH